jgi:glycosyltransferase 2 family protein
MDQWIRHFPGRTDLYKDKRFWFGLIISFGFLALFLYRTNFHEIADAFGGADYALAFAAVPLYFVGFWVRTIRWRVLMRPVRDIPTQRLYPVVLVGLMANNVLPARVGELVRAYLVGERENVSKPSALGTIAVDRVFDGLTLVGILASVSAFSGVDATVKYTGIGTAIVFFAATVFLFGLAFSPERARGWLLTFLRWLPTGIEHKLEDLLDSFILGLHSLRRPSVLLSACALSLASWSIETLMYAVVGKAFGLHVGFEVYFLIAAAANLALSILASPGGVGPFEVTAQAILVDIYGVTAKTASAYALALHALLLAPVIIAGFAILWASQLSLGDMLGVRSSKIVAVPPATE